MTPWYFHKDNQKFGPFTGGQIKELALMGKLDKQDLVQKGEDGKPVTAMKVKGLFEPDKNTVKRPTIPAAKQLHKTAAPPPIPSKIIDRQSTAAPEPPVKSVNTESATATTPKLWNPTALRLWSLLFTWGFGAFLLSRNWKALGDPRRAARSMYWFYSAIAFLVLAFLLPDSNGINSTFRGVFLVILAAWALLDAQPQINLLKERFGNEYQRKSWGKPLGLAMAFLVLPVIGLVYSTSFPQEILTVRYGQFEQYPGINIGDLVDDFLGSSKWSTTTDAQGNKFVVVSGEMFNDGQPATAQLTFRVEGQDFRLESAALNGQAQGEDFADALVSAMYLGFVEAEPVLNSNSEQGAIKIPATSNASGKKLTAFRRIVEKYKQGVGAYATDTERSDFNEELEALQKEFYRIPFDPRIQLEEARAIAELYDSEIGNRYSGNLAMELNNYLSEMVDKMLDQ